MSVKADKGNNFFFAMGNPANIFITFTGCIHLVITPVDHRDPNRLSVNL
jgi:hypothetical protein